MAASFAGVGCASTTPSSRPPAKPPSAGTAAAVASVPSSDGPRWPDLTLAASSERSPPPQGVPIVVVSRRAIHLDRGPMLVPLPADPDARRHGVDARYKRSGPKDLVVAPLADALRAQRGTEAAFAFDAATPFRLVVETLFTATQVEKTTFHLLVAHGEGLAAIPLRPPRRAGDLPDGPASLGLTVLLVTDGIGLKARGGNVMPGCSDVGPGLSFPRVAGKHDYAGLQGCVAKLRAVTGLTDERSVTVAANPDVPFGDLIQAIDHVRRSSTGAPLFTDVGLGIAR